MKKAISSASYNDLIGWLKQARVELGWSMRDFAFQLGEPHSFVQKVESLERRLDVYEYCIYSKALGLDPSEGLKFFD